MAEKKSKDKAKSKGKVKINHSRYRVIKMKTILIEDVDPALLGPAAEEIILATIVEGAIVQGKIGKVWIIAGPGMSKTDVEAAYEAGLSQSPVKLDSVRHTHQDSTSS